VKRLAVFLIALLAANVAHARADAAGGEIGGAVIASRASNMGGQLDTQ
jgi:hypothetical protein